MKHVHEIVVWPFGFLTVFQLLMGFSATLTASQESHSLWGHFFNIYFSVPVTDPRNRFVKIVQSCSRLWSPLSTQEESLWAWLLTTLRRSLQFLAGRGRRYCNPAKKPSFPTSTSREQRPVGNESTEPATARKGWSMMTNNQGFWLKQDLDSWHAEEGMTIHERLKNASRWQLPASTPRAWRESLIAVTMGTFFISLDLVYSFLIRKDKCH